MTKVIQRILCGWAMAVLFFASFSAGASGQSTESAAGQVHAAQDSTKPALPQSAQALYLQLGSVGLDRARVYHVREANLDRSALHITLEDGTIAFTADVAGRVTGAFFQGTGEVLLMPPNQMERASMVLFTHAAILEEEFDSGYFRFNDNTFAELQPFLQPAENGSEFFEEWEETARNLAANDALRLLLTFSKLLPENGSGRMEAVGRTPDKNDRLLHARLQGKTLGTFDVCFDSTMAEQIWAGQLQTADGVNYYNMWTSFGVTPAGAASAEGTAEQTGPGSDTFHIADYKIRAEVRPPQQLKADARLQLEVRHGGDRAVLFELSRFLELQKVEADGHPLEFIHNPAVEGSQLQRRGNDLVAVVFPKPLQTGERVELRFVYQGDVLSSAGGGLLYVGARGIWYPNRGLAMANFDMEFHYPKEWTLVATGKREALPAVAGNLNAADTASGEQASRWVSERPIPLAGFNLGKYSRDTAKAGNIEVDTYATSDVERSFPQVSTAVPTPGGPIAPLGRDRAMTVVPLVVSPARNAASVSAFAARAVKFLAERFGPFPYSTLSLTQMPGRLSQGWPGLVFLSSYAFLTPDEEAAMHVSPLERIRNRGTIAHETAHQWWGDLVTWSSYRDQWMVEGLAEYSSLMLLQSENPAAFQAILKQYRDDLLQKNKNGSPVMDAGPVTLGGRLSNSQFPSGYETISYERGAWLFHMLRCMMQDAELKAGRHSNGMKPGDEPFVRALRRLRQRYQGQAITTREMLRVFEEDLPTTLRYEGRESLDWFYDGWINGTAIPRLELQGVRYADRADSTLIRGTILQKEAPEDLVTCVPVYATLGGRSIFLGLVFADGASTDFRLTAPAHARKVVLDPKQVLLTRNR